MTAHNKLVRDKVPERIRSDGLEPVTVNLNEAEFQEAVFDKVVEEAHELAEARTLEEFGDLEEALLAAAAVRGFTPEQITEARRAKAKTHGAFVDRVFLVEVLGE